MLISNCTNNTGNRWVTLEDGVATAYALTEIQTKQNEGGQEVIKLIQRVIEKKIEFTDEKELRMRAALWTRKGEVEVEVAPPAPKTVVLEGTGDAGPG
jgi:hypothetical protein